MTEPPRCLKIFMNLTGLMESLRSLWGKFTFLWYGVFQSLIWHISLGLYCLSIKFYTFHTVVLHVLLYRFFPCILYNIVTIFYFLCYLLLVFGSTVAFVFSDVAKALNSSNVFLIPFVFFLLWNPKSMSSENFLFSFYILIFLVFLCLLEFIVQHSLEVTIVDFLPVFLISRGTLLVSSVNYGIRWRCFCNYS